ncbi:sugar kinase [Subtercola boreus]|uniref:Sugar kinase n=2 Tax=Subtercola boreus TaxID=120213 RepID=A0A3E0VCZ6_9MICO|nr:sugar kinase [Subtercola boreus]
MALLKAEQPGPLAHASSLGLGIGGSESNVAIGVSRLGGSAVWCGRVGDDSLGQLVVREIRAEGVEVRAIVDGGAPTGLMIKERRTAHTQKVTYYRAGSAGSRFSVEDLDEDLVRGAGVLHLTGITPALSASAADAVFEAIGLARASGVTISFDLNYRSTLWSAEAAADAYRRLLPLVDVVFAGYDEAALVVGEAPSEVLAARLAEFGPAQAIIKRGHLGAVAVIDGAVHWQPPVPISPLDTVGAGDAFVAGYLAELLLPGDPGGSTPEARLALAAQAGAFACLAPGDWEGLPTRAELHLLDTVEPVAR